VDDGDGVEEAVAPGVADGAAGIEDGGAIELLGEVLLELAGRGNDPVMHRRASCTNVSFSSTSVTGGPSMLKSLEDYGFQFA
jgi:hypothetical protein